MPDLLLRRNTIVKAYPDEFLVILPQIDGYELQVGTVAKHTGAHQQVLWHWSCPGGTGRSETREFAMADLRAAWSATDEQIAEMRRQQESTEWKYLLWNAGYRSQMAHDEIQCQCGAMFDPSDHEAVRAHVDHVARRSRSNRS